jgi:hypothetical protein
MVRPLPAYFSALVSPSWTMRYADRSIPPRCRQARLRCEARRPARPSASDLPASRYRRPQAVACTKSHAKCLARVNRRLRSLLNLGLRIWKAGWVHALAGSNPASSASNADPAATVSLSGTGGRTVARRQPAGRTPCERRSDRRGRTPTSERCSCGPARRIDECR